MSLWLRTVDQVQSHEEINRGFQLTADRDLFGQTQLYQSLDADVTMLWLEPPQCPLLSPLQFLPVAEVDHRVNFRVNGHSRRLVHLISGNKLLLRRLILY